MIQLIFLVHYFQKARNLKMNDKLIIEALKKEICELKKRYELLDEYNEQCIYEIERLRTELAKEKAFRKTLAKVTEMPDDYEIIETELPF